MTDSGAGEELLATDKAAKAKIRIVVVDDDRTLRESCTKFLEIEGYNITAAGEGDEAFQVLSERDFDIALIDLYMAGVTGTELMLAALAKNPECVVIIMTGHPSVQSAIKAIYAGAWDYLPKPFSATHLQVLMGRAAYGIQNRNAAGELEEVQGHLRCPACGTLVRKRM